MSIEGLRRQRDELDRMISNLAEREKRIKDQSPFPLELSFYAENVISEKVLKVLNESVGEVVKLTVRVDSITLGHSDKLDIHVFGFGLDAEK